MINILNKSNDISLFGIQKKNWIYVILLAFVSINLVCIYHEFYFFSFLPLVLLFVLLAFVSLDRLLIIISFFAPLSITLKSFSLDLNFDMYIPTEPLLAGILLLVLFKYIFERNFDKNIIFHPVSIAILFNLCWILITSFTSTDKLVSFKFLIARMWFVIPFFYLGTQLFKNKKRVYQFFLAYILGLVIVIFYTWIRHLDYGMMELRAAHYLMRPFFNDHTAYGASLAMFLPVIVIITTIEKSFFSKIFLFFIACIIFIALLLSYSRAAWISILVSLGIYIILRLKIKFSVVITAGILLSLLIYFSWVPLMMKLSKNNQDSNIDITKHLQSISNITTDASNLERINRWNCAMKMFKEKYIFGWGPGTYMYEYTPFQMSKDKTIISTNASDRGNAHSEYIGPLAESGILGMVSFLFILITSIYTGIKNYSIVENKYFRVFNLAALLGLVSYYIHGGLNNFLDTDKASIPFWGFIAILVSIDVYHSGKQKN